jgi:hypothetical protein
VSTQRIVEHFKYLPSIIRGNGWELLSKTTKVQEKSCPKQVKGSAEYAEIKILKNTAESAEHAEQS